MFVWRERERVRVCVCVRVRVCAYNLHTHVLDNARVIQRECECVRESVCAYVCVCIYRESVFV